jgi:cytochrome b pre-mRNA-processing protein 3
VGLQHWFGRSRPEARPAAALYAALVAQARAPDFYARLGAADTLEGRFEVYALHLALLVLRLKEEGVAGEALSQALFDRFVRGLDDGLREAGVGDTGVPRKMKTLGQALYGRLNGYAEAFEALPDETPLGELVARTVVAEGEGDAAGLAAYVVRAREALAAEPPARLLAGEVAWAPVGAG